MNDVLSLIDQGRLRAAALNDELSARFRLSPGDAPIGAFNMVNQYAIVALELLTFYSRVWAPLVPGAGPDAARTRLENGERVITITKAVFILSLSAFEFSAKQAVRNRPDRIAPITGRVYLRRIIQESVAAGWLPAADDSPWEGLVQVRNMLVHNNGIADATATYPIPNGPTITMTAGAMTQGNLRFFPELVLWSIEAFGRWSEGYLC